MFQILWTFGLFQQPLTIDDLTLDGATLKNIVLGAQRISRIEAAYTLSELRRGRIERVVFSNVQGRAQWRGGVLTLPGLTPPRPGGPGGGAARKSDVRKPSPDSGRLRKQGNP